MLELVVFNLLLTTSVMTMKSFLNSFNFMPNYLRNTYPKFLNLNESFFPSLENYEHNALPVKESDYAWIARVVHSRSANMPHVCTATCIDEAIFITAARCIYTLKVDLTTIIYNATRYHAISFVVPSKPTKQLYDDIGFIVVDNKYARGRSWSIIGLYDGTNRTDEAFRWFAELDTTFGMRQYRVVGYATQKGFQNAIVTERHYDLAALDVIIEREICSKILTKFDKINGFHVPCYYGCNYAQFEQNYAKCNDYHGVEGGALIDIWSNKLMGVATWGGHFTNHELPVGFSVVNSANFFNDLTCARRIRDNNGFLIMKGYYQRLCNGL